MCEMHGSVTKYNVHKVNSSLVSKVTKLQPQATQENKNILPQTMFT